MARNLEVRIVGDASSLHRALGQAGGAASTFGRNMARLGAVAAGAAAAGLGVAVGKAVEFDRGMRNVNSIAKLSEAQLAALSKETLKLAGPTGQAPKVLTAGLYEIVSSGFKAKDAIKILGVSAKAATAGMTDTATSTKAVVAALNAYHKGAGEARKVSDVLFTTVQKGVLTFDELAQNMGDLVPAAAPLGISLEEVGAAMSTVTLQGVPAAEAATRVKNTMLQLAKPSAALSGLLREAGFASGEAAIKSEGFAGVLQILQNKTKGSVTETSKLTPEIRSLLGVVGLTGKNLATYNEHLQAHKDASTGAGAAASAFAEQSKSVSVQWDKAKASLNVLAIEIGSALLPALNSALTFVQSHWPEISSVMATVMGAVKTAIGTTVDFIKTHWESISAVFSTVGRTVATVAGGMADAVRQHFGTMKAIVMEVVNFFRSDVGQAVAGAAVGFIAFQKAALLIEGAMVAAKAAVLAFGAAATGLAANPIVLTMSLIGAAIGAILIPGMLSGRQSVTDFAGAVDHARGVLDALQGSIDRLKGAQLSHAEAQARLIASEHGVTAAREAALATVKRYGAGSLEAKQASDLYTSAVLAQERATLTLKESTSALGAEQTKRAAELSGPVSDAFRKLQTEGDKLRTAIGNLQGPFKQINEAKLAPKLIEYSNAMRGFGEESLKTSGKLQAIDPAAARASSKAATLAFTAADLAVKLGRVPTNKEIIAAARITGLAGFTKGLSDMPRLADAASKGTKTAIEGGGPGAESAGAKVGQKGATGVGKGAAQMGPKAGKEAAKVGPIIGGFASAAFTGGFSTGTSAGQGVAAGIRSQIGAIAAAAAAASAASVIHMQRALRTGSRSKETYEKAGIPAGQGLVEGITDYLKANGTKVADAAKQAVAIAGAVTPAIVAAGNVLGLAKARAIAMGVMQGAPSLKQQILTALSDATKEAIAAAAAKVSEAREAFSSAFGELANSALAAFDSQVAKWKSPAAKLLAKMQLQDQLKQLNSAITAGTAGIETAQAGLTAALAGGDPEAIKAAQAAVLAAQETFNQAVRAKEEFNLGQLAAKQEAAHAKAMERKRVQFENQLIQLQNALARHPEEHEKIQGKIKKLLEKFVPGFQASGAAIGYAIAQGLRESTAAVEKEAEKLAQAIANKLKLKSPAKEGPLSTLDSWWKGFAPTLLSGLDMKAINGALALATPGGGTMPGASGRMAGGGMAMAGGSGGSMTVHVHVAGSVIRERDLARSVRDEIVRAGKSNAGGMFGGNA